jgi:hypothetical protein
MALITCYFLTELLPIYLVVDASFMSLISAEMGQSLNSLTEPLFE